MGHSHSVNDDGGGGVEEEAGHTVNDDTHSIEKTHMMKQKKISREEEVGEAVAVHIHFLDDMQTQDIRDDNDVLGGDDEQEVDGGGGEIEEAEVEEPVGDYVVMEVEGHHLIS